jgi:hypothetical protein
MSAMFLNIIRNKRSVSVDVKNPRGREIVLDLAKGADVFMQNFRPGVVDRLGVGESDIRRVAPSIIYTSISGFGDVGPWVGKPVYDPVIQAVSGLTTVQAGSDQERPRLIRPCCPTSSPASPSRSLSRPPSFRGTHRRDSTCGSPCWIRCCISCGPPTWGRRPIGHAMTNQEAASFIDLITKPRTAT